MKKTMLVILAILVLMSLASCTKTPPDAPQKTYVFRYGQTEIAVDAEAEGILSQLGAYLDYAESPSCAFEGMDKVYLYSGFRVQTYSLGGKDYIHSVELTDDSVSTPEGVTVGSTVADVTAAYGTPTSSTETSLTYADSANGMYLQFILRGGTVTNVSYVTETKAPG